MLGSLRMKLTQAFLPEFSWRYSPCRCTKMLKMLKITNIPKILKMRMMRMMRMLEICIRSLQSIAMLH